MTNIVRTDPFQELARFEPFRDLELIAPWARFRRWMQELPDEPMIKLDLTEDDKAFFVKAELPGVKKEDIAIEVEANHVSIVAETRRETEEKKGEAVVHSERYFGRQSRMFTLGNDIDREKVTAKFSDGVLSVTLPKAGTPSTTARIPIN